MKDNEPIKGAYLREYFSEKNHQIISAYFSSKHQIQCLVEQLKESKARKTKITIQIPRDNYSGKYRSRTIPVRMDDLIEALNDYGKKLGERGYEMMERGYQLYKMKEEKNEQLK